MVVKTFGIASGIGAGQYGAQLGVWDLYYSLNKYCNNLNFNNIYHNNSHKTKLDALPVLADFYKDIQVDITKHFDPKDKYLFLIGDHSGAMATWSSLSNNLKEDIGIIWVDAHLDLHTPSTTPSQNIHGMPLATLMGYGDKLLSDLIDNKIKPQNLVFIGTRDYEAEELELLNKLGIKIFYMDNICRNNINDVFKQAYDYLASRVNYIGVSLDIDSMEPSQMPATGCYNPGGLLLEDVITNIAHISKQDKFIALEITEFNPLLDVNRKTFNGIMELLKKCF